MYGTYLYSSSDGIRMGFLSAFRTMSSELVYAHQMRVMYLLLPTSTITALVLTHPSESGATTL